MDHYFLHLRDGAKLIRDPDGSLMPNVRAAELESIESARELMSQSIVIAGRIGIYRSFEISDRSDRTLLIVPFRDALARHDEVRLFLDARKSREARWRNLAEEARATANTVEDGEDRRLLLKIAMTYQRLAERAKARKRQY